jgi:hypothetical protein
MEHLLPPRAGESRGQAVLRKAANAGQPWRRPTYEHHGLGGVSEPGTYASWNWSWGNWKWGRNEEAITQHPAPPDP